MLQNVELGMISNQLSATAQHRPPCTRVLALGMFASYDTTWKNQRSLAALRFGDDFARVNVRPSESKIAHGHDLYGEIRLTAVA